MPNKGMRYIRVDAKIHVVADRGCRYCKTCLDCKYKDCRLYSNKNNEVEE